MTQTKTRVGVLLVHGIGEQGRFQHLESEVRHIAAAMSNEANVKSSRVVVRHSRDGAYGAQQATWRSDDVAPVTIEVIDKNDNVTDIDFREVWWADLDEPSTPINQIRFWAWVLSVWSTRGYMESTQPGYHEWMRPICKATTNVNWRSQSVLTAMIR